MTNDQTEMLSHLHRYDAWMTQRWAGGPEGPCAALAAHEAQMWRDCRAAIARHAAAAHLRTEPAQ